MTTKKATNSRLRALEKIARSVKRSISESARTLDVWREERSGTPFEYFAIHDGRTLNASSNVDSGPSLLSLRGGTSLALPEPKVEEHRRIWVVDLLAFGLPAGDYRLVATGSGGIEHDMRVPRKFKIRGDEPAQDGKIVDLNDLSAEVHSTKGAISIRIVNGDCRPRVLSLNYLGTDAFSIVTSPKAGHHEILAIERDTRVTKVIGEIHNGIGNMRVTRLPEVAASEESRWDVALRDENGTVKELNGPAVDYSRPDQATSYGDVTFIREGVKDRWKPYISRNSQLAVRVTSELTVAEK